MPTTLKEPSLLSGIAIVAGTAIGAGMFSLPIISAGMWFGWSIAVLAFSWFCMFHSSLFILEVNLHFKAGASFDTFIGQTLGPRWNAINNLSISFVLIILTYAYISGGGSIVAHTLNSSGLNVPQALSSLLFAFSLAFVIWLSTAWAGRLISLLVGTLLLVFLLSINGLLGQLSKTILLNMKPDYAFYVFAAIPYFLTSFGYHGNVPSLVKLYNKDANRVQRCMLYGSLLAMIIYSLWLLVTLGTIPRQNFPAIIADGGNIGNLVGALSTVLDTAWLANLLNIFANIAVISSFLGVTLGLFDYIADKFGFDDTGPGRLKTALITFLPPTIASLLLPNGFLYAIGIAGLFACIWGAIIPSLAVRAARKKFPSSDYQVWGGERLIHFILAYGVLVFTCFLLTALGILSVFN